MLLLYYRRYMSDWPQLVPAALLRDFILMTLPKVMSCDSATVPSYTVRRVVSRTINLETLSYLTRPRHQRGHSFVGTVCRHVSHMMNAFEGTGYQCAGQFARSLQCCDFVIVRLSEGVRRYGSSLG